MKRLLSGLAATLLLTFGAVPTAGAQTWNLANDFSTTTNGGTNPWSYGQYSGALNPITFAPFAVYELRDTGKLATWWRGAPNPIDPNIQKNITGSSYAQSGSGITFNPGQVTFGPYLGPTVARWTAPFAGVFSVNAAFQTVQTQNSAPTAYVYRGTAVIGNAALTSPASFSSFTPLSLAAGETIDFVVWGDNQNNKTTQVQATITAVPEPGSVALVAAGLLGLGAVARRRRRA